VASALDGIRPRYDVVIVGARAAGASTALLLARRGVRVLVVDKESPAADTISTHALMRAGVLQLKRWGLLPEIERAGTPPVNRTVFYYADETVDIPIPPKGGVPALFAPRRTLLDPVLAEAAAESGADVRHGVRLADLLHGADGRVEGVLLADSEGGARAVFASVVVGADGLRSTVAKLVEAPITREGRHASATLYGYWSRLDTDGYHWYWGNGCGAGEIPTNGGHVLVFVGLPSHALKEDARSGVPAAYRSLIEQASPALAERLTCARLSGTLRGFPGHRGRMRRPWGPGWALVGDAASFKDPITAHGLTDALRDAELLANAITSGGSPRAFAAYEAERDALTTRLFDVSDRVASFQWDTSTLKELHRELSDEMKKETARVLSWDLEPTVALAS
jgi:2-polyprenyl-6-methoxyphenol hydroxylase-like FAD-dependent oxidoreductase